MIENTNGTIAYIEPLKYSSSLIECKTKYEHGQTAEKTKCRNMHIYMYMYTM